MHCQNCGREIKDRDLFCEYCGANQQLKNDAPKKRRTGLIVAIACLTLLVVLGIAAVFFLKMYDDGNLFAPKDDVEISEEAEEKEADDADAESADADFLREEEEDSSYESGENESEAAPDESEKEQEEQAKESGKSEPFEKSHIERVESTSSLSEYDMTHSAERVIDEDISTAWVEGVSGQGIGETITFYFDGEYTISRFLISAGYQKSASLYERNSRPAEVMLEFSDGTRQTYALQDINGTQEIVLDTPVTTDYVAMTIESVYQGSKYEDTAITEIAIH